MRRWKTKGGVVVVEAGRCVVMDKRGRPAVKVYAYKETGGFHGLLWLDNLRPAGIAKRRRPSRRVVGQRRGQKRRESK